MDSLPRLIVRAAAWGVGSQLGRSVVLGVVGLLAAAFGAHAYGVVAPTGSSAKQQYRFVAGFPASYVCPENGQWIFSSPSAAFAVWNTCSTPPGGFTPGFYQEQVSPTSGQFYTRGPDNGSNGGIYGQGSWGLESRTVNDPTCASDSLKVGQDCVCNIGTRAAPPTVPGGQSTSCVPINCEATVDSGLRYAGNTGGENSVVGVRVANGTGSLEQCYQGCVVRGTGVSSTGSENFLSNPSAVGTYCEGNPAAPSSTPSATDPTTVEPLPKPLPPGRCPGQVNGVDVPGGVPCASTTTGSTKTEQKPDGSKTTTTSETKCAAGSCVTTETTQTRNPDGSLGPTSTTITRGFDTNNINSAAGGNGTGGVKGSGAGGDCVGGAAAGCGNESSSFTGDCATSFVCNGDAVQCAMARDQHIRHCQAWETMTPALQAVAAAASGAASQPEGHPFRDSPTLPFLGSGGALDQGDLIGGGACPVDRVFEVTAGVSVTIPFSEICDSAEMLGNIGVAFTALACLSIMFVRTGGAS